MRDNNHQGELRPVSDDTTTTGRQPAVTLRFSTHQEYFYFIDEHIRRRSADQVQAAQVLGFNTMLAGTGLQARSNGNGGLDLVDNTMEPDGESASDDDEDAGAEVVPPGPLGDSGVLADLGVAEKDLLTLDGADALSEIADALGASEVLETVR